MLHKKCRQHWIDFFCVYVSEIHRIFRWMSFIHLGNFLAPVYCSVLLLILVRHHVHAYVLMILMHCRIFCLMWVQLLLLLFSVFETGSYYIGLAGLEFHMEMKLASNSQRPLPLMGMHHCAQFFQSFFCLVTSSIFSLL